MNRLDEAEAVVKQAEERKLGERGAAWRPLPISFSKGRHGTDWHTSCRPPWGKPGMEDVLLDAQANTEAWARAIERRPPTDAARNEYSRAK